MVQIKLSKIKDKYDVVIVGGGLGGMTTANRLGKEGYSVLLLEQNPQLGGFATWFKKKGGHTFDISLHAFPEGMRQAFRMHWNKKMADCVIPLKEVRFDNPQFSLETRYDREDLKKILHDKFDISTKVIDGFFSSMQLKAFLSDETTKIKEMFDRFFPGRSDVIRLLMEVNAYTNSLTLDDPASVYSIVFFNFIKKGMFTFKYGTDRMIILAIDELRRNKVDIFTNALVDKIYVEKGQVQGVSVEGRDLTAKVVVSNVNLLSTIYDLVGEDYFSKRYIEQAKKIRLTNSACQVYMGIKKNETIPYIGDFIFTSTYKEFNTEALVAKDITSRSFSVYYPDIRPDNKDYTIIGSTNARYDDWFYLSEDQYREEKRKLIASTIDCLERYLPRLKEKIDYVEAATPKTFERYSLHRKGACFGTKFEGLKVSREMSKQIRGLFHTGSVGIIMSGWLGVVNYGAIVGYNVDKKLKDGSMVRDS